MKKVDVQVELPEDVKESFEATCKKMGLTMEMAFTIFAYEVATRHCIPFDIDEDDKLPF